MNCPSCHELTDEGAAFCGNCGQQLQVVASNSPIAQTFASQVVPPVAGQAMAPLALAGTQGVPAYALGNVQIHKAENKAILSVIFGVTGLAGALFFAVIGLAIGLAGLILGTLSRRSPHRAVSTAGIVVSSLAILVSLGVWSYTFMHSADSKKNANQKVQALNSSSAIAANNVTTSCYSAGFDGELNIATSENSCDMQAYNGSTLQNSTLAYKIYGYTQPAVTPTSFGGFAKQALEKDIHENLPKFTIGKETAGQFAGKPAYFVTATNSAEGVAYIEAAVLNTNVAKDKNNLFVFVHAMTGTEANLQGLEKSWQWK